MQRAKQNLAAKDAAPAETPRLEVRQRREGRVTSRFRTSIGEAADYYVCLHVGTKSHLLRKSMAELEQELDRASFCRIHRSTIVNLRKSVP